MEIDTRRFGRELAAIRDLRQVTQSVVAERSGLTLNYISLLETGQRSPSIEAINSLAKALDVPAQFLVFLGSNAPKKGPLKDLFAETEAAIRTALAAEQSAKTK